MLPVLEVSVSQSWKLGFREIELDSESLIMKFSLYASDERSQVQLPHTSPAITASAPLNRQQ